MKRIVSLTVLIFLVLSVLGQSDTDKDSIYGEVDGQLVYENPHVLPIFGDCKKVEKRKKDKSKEEIEKCSQANFFQFLARNHGYPEEARLNKISGTVYIEFIVDSTGKVTNVGVLRGIAGGDILNKQALRMIQSCPNWKPGEQNGKKVSTRFVIPVRYALQ